MSLPSCSQYNTPFPSHRFCSSPSLISLIVLSTRAVVVIVVSSLLRRHINSSSESYIVLHDSLLSVYVSVPTKGSAPDEIASHVFPLQSPRNSLSLHKAGKASSFPKTVWGFLVVHWPSFVHQTLHGCMHPHHHHHHHRRRRRRTFRSLEHSLKRLPSYATGRYYLPLDQRELLAFGSVSFHSLPFLAHARNPVYRLSSRRTSHRQHISRFFHFSYFGWLWYVLWFIFNCCSFVLNAMMVAYWLLFVVYFVCVDFFRSFSPSIGFIHVTVPSFYLLLSLSFSFSLTVFYSSGSLMHHHLSVSASRRHSLAVFVYPFFRIHRFSCSPSYPGEGKLKRVVCPMLSCLWPHIVL